MTTVTLKAEIPEELYNKFHRAATDKNGKWRGSKQSADKAFQTAVQAALLSFLSNLKEPDLADRMIKTLINE